MAYIKFYSREREEFKTAGDTHIFEPDITKIFKKLCRHFKIRRTELRVGMALDGHGRASYNGFYYTIKVAHKTDFLILCHELSHVCNRQRYNNWKHNKKLMKTLRRIIKYCEKKGYWGLVPQTSTSPTEVQNYPDSQSQASAP